MRMRNRGLAVVAAMALAGVIGAGGPAKAAGVDSLREDNPVPDTSKETEIYRVRESDQRFRRDYAAQPPLVPHKIAKYEISRNVNECLDCHGADTYIEENASKISQTHYVGREGNLQMNSPDAGRWNCNQCHVPQTDAEPLVDNTFSMTLR